MIIDIHTHDFWKEGSYEEPDKVVAQAQKAGIDYIVNLGDVSHFGYYPDAEQIKIINDRTREHVRRYSPYMYGFCFLNPANPASNVLDEMHRCLEEPEFHGVKLEVSLNCRAPELDIIMETLHELNMPLLHHCWYKTVSKCPQESDPSDIACLARRFPDVKIIMAHLCADGIRGVEDVADCPNVSIDTSGAQPEAGILEYAVKRIGAHRILYGSDAPCRNFSVQLAKIEEADIPESDKRLILSENAKEVLHL